MGRRRRSQRAGRSKGGSLTSLRGGFQSVAHVMTKNPGRPASRTRRVLGNVVTVVLLLVTAWFLLRRFGLLHR